MALLHLEIHTSIKFLKAFNVRILSRLPIRDILIKLYSNVYEVQMVCVK